jgi:hypothetical protein
VEIVEVVKERAGKITLMGFEETRAPRREKQIGD